MLENVKRPRLFSLGNISAPPIDRGYRFSSVGGGGYNTLLRPPKRRYSAASFLSERYHGSAHVRQRSTSIESPRFSSASKRIDDNQYRQSISESDGEEADDEFEQITVTADINHQPQSFLCVPKVSRCNVQLKTVHLNYFNILFFSGSGI